LENILGRIKVKRADLPGERIRKISASTASRSSTYDVFSEYIYQELFYSFHQKNGVFDNGIFHAELTYDNESITGKFDEKKYNNINYLETRMHNNIVDFNNIKVCKK
jgi:hypothetical protein